MVGICTQPRRCSTTSSRVRPVTAIICGRSRGMTEPRETKKSSQTVGFSRTIIGLHPDEQTQTTTNGRKQIVRDSHRYLSQPHRECEVQFRNLATRELPLSTSPQVSLARGPARADRQPCR